MVKGVLLAGGTGSRLYPLTRITNKHLLPIYDKPMVAYGVEALVKSGITDIMVVTGGTHAGEFLRLLSNGHEYGVDRLSYAYQDSAGGIAHALALAERFVGDDQVMVLLADNIFEYSIASTIEQFKEQKDGARIILAPVEEEEHLHHLGVPELSDDGKVTAIIEKPSDPPSSYCVTGAYCYDASVFQIIKNLEPSARNELEITDVNNYFIKDGTMEYDIAKGFWGDAGESIDAYYVVNDYVRKFGANK